MRSLLVIAILLLCSAAHAQSTFDWSLTNTSATVSGSGTFEVGQWTTAGGPVLYPINNLSGTLNGLHLSLTPGYIIANPNSLAGINNGNAFYTLSQPIASSWPLHFQSGQRLFTIFQSDFPQPGVTGQLLGDSLSVLTGGVTFAVRPVTVSPPETSTKIHGAPKPKQHTLMAGFLAPTPQQIASADTRRVQMNLGLEVGVPVAFAVTSYLIHRYGWRHHHDAHR